jgi:hypothetical protein
MIKLCYLDMLQQQLLCSVFLAYIDFEPRGSSFFFFFFFVILMTFISSVCVSISITFIAAPS